MTTGNPNPNPNPTPPIRKKEGLEEIPLSYFTGFGSKGGGIDSIDFSKEFYDLAPELKSLIVLHESRVDRTRVRNDTFVQYTSKIEDETGEITEAERKIKEITHFSIQELHTKLDELRRLYKGQKEAPPGLKLKLAPS